MVRYRGREDRGGGRGGGEIPGPGPQGSLSGEIECRGSLEAAWSGRPIYRVKHREDRERGGGEVLLSCTVSLGLPFPPLPLPPLSPTLSLFPLLSFPMLLHLTVYPLSHWPL